MVKKAMYKQYKLIDTHRLTFLIVDKFARYDIDNPVAILKKRAYTLEEAQAECDRLNAEYEKEQA